MDSAKTPSAPKKTGGKKTLAITGKIILTIIKITIIAVLVVSFALGGIAGGAVLGYIKTAEPIKDEQLAMAFNKTTFIYDSEGNEIAKLTGKDNKDSEPVSEKDVPKFLTDAIISIEDERFEEHNGIDFQGMINIGYTFLTNKGNPRGGSTITMQVVRNITGNYELSLQRKVQEWYAAVQLEKKLSKWQIIELYMNISYWGNSCYGVGSASKKYFGKSVTELNLAQCALLAGITNSPGRYNPFTEKGRENAKDRQEIILAKMLELGKISQAEHDDAVKADVEFKISEENKSSVSIQSYFVDQVISDVKAALMEQKNLSSAMASSLIYNNGLEIYTTQDPKMQTIMDTVFNNKEFFPNENKKAIEYSELPQAAMVIIDAANGQVKAMYGGSGKKEASNTLNRAASTLMQRQPGSSFKPIAVYGPAIDLKLVTPATIVDDIPVYLMTGKATEAYPTNYDFQYDGLTTVRNALKASVNVVAAKVWLNTLGPDNSLNYLKKAGIDRSDERYLSLVLGGLNKGVNPLQMAAAYVPFTAKGMYYEPSTFSLVKDSEGDKLIEPPSGYEIVYSEQAASIMANMMQEVTSGKNSPYPHGGTAASYITKTSIGMPVAGKTGTTSNNIDKWFVGYTPYYSAAVWYGYDNKIKPVTLEKSEYNQAMKIWAAVMSKVHEGLEQKEFPIADGLVKKKICIYSGKIATALCEKDPRGNATRTEYFIRGTEPRENDTCTVHIEASVCTASQDLNKRYLLAGPYCPVDTVSTAVYIQRTEPYVPVIPDEKAPKDLIYELPAGEFCTVHGAPPVVPDVTDPNIYMPGVNPNDQATTILPDGSILTPDGIIVPGTSAEPPSTNIPPAAAPPQTPASVPANP